MIPVGDSEPAVPQKHKGTVGIYYLGVLEYRVKVHMLVHIGLGHGFSHRLIDGDGWLKPAAWLHRPAYAYGLA